MKKKIGIVFYFLGVIAVLISFTIPVHITSGKTMNDTEENEIFEDNRSDKDYIETDGEALEKGEKVKKIAYLTFDDGPSKNTSKILNILKKYNVKATFFVNGKPIYKDMYIRINKEGHKIGNHTYCHEYNEIYTSVEDFKSDVNKLNRLLIEYGIKPNYMLRFPGGSNNTVSEKYGGKIIMDELVQVMSEEGYKYYDWNVTSGDAATAAFSAEEIVEKVTEDVVKYKTSVVLLHDADDKQATVEALDPLIEALEAMNAEILPIDDDTQAIQYVRIDSAE